MTNAPAPIKPVRAGSLPRLTTAPAKWSKWKLIPQCNLWEATCLSLDIEPNTNGAHEWLTRKRSPDGFPAEFSERLDILTANFYADVFRMVQIADVATAAIGWGWVIPEAMKSLTPIGEDRDTPTETKEQRQDRRLQMCETDGLNFKNYRGRLPDGVGKLAATEGVTRQSFSVDVKAALMRRESATREGMKGHHA
jgi:hypothetical protein